MRHHVGIWGVRFLCMFSWFDKENQWRVNSWIPFIQLEAANMEEVGYFHQFQLMYNWHLGRMYLLQSPLHSPPHPATFLPGCWGVCSAEPAPGCHGNRRVYRRQHVGRSLRKKGGLCLFNNDDNKLGAKARCCLQNEKKRKKAFAESLWWVVELPCRAINKWVQAMIMAPLNL